MFLRTLSKHFELQLIVEVIFTLFGTKSPNVTMPPLFVYLISAANRKNFILHSARGRQLQTTRFQPRDCHLRREPRHTAAASAGFSFVPPPRAQPGDGGTPTGGGFAKRRGGSGC